MNCERTPEISPAVTAGVLELCRAALDGNAAPSCRNKLSFCLTLSPFSAHISAWIEGECVYQCDSIVLKASMFQTEEEILRNIAAALDDIDKLKKTWEGFAQGGAHA